MPAVALEGLDDEDRAVEAWKRALGALLAENLTAAEQRQKEQYNSQLTETEARLKELKPITRGRKITVEGDPTPLEYEKMSWKRARAIIPDFIESQTWDNGVRHKPPLLGLHCRLLLWLCRHG